MLIFLNVNVILLYCGLNIVYTPSAYPTPKPTASSYLNTSTGFIVDIAGFGIPLEICMNEQFVGQYISFKYSCNSAKDTIYYSEWDKTDDCSGSGTIMSQFVKGNLSTFNCEMNVNYWTAIKWGNQTGSCVQNNDYWVQHPVVTDLCLSSPTMGYSVIIHDCTDCGCSKSTYMDPTCTGQLLGYETFGDALCQQGECWTANPSVCSQTQTCLNSTINDTSSPPITAPDCQALEIKHLETLFPTEQSFNEFNQIFVNDTNNEPLIYNQRRVWTNGNLEIVFTDRFKEDGNWYITNQTYSAISTIDANLNNSLVYNISDPNAISHTQSLPGPYPRGYIYYDHFPHDNILVAPDQEASLYFTCSDTSFPTMSIAPSLTTINPTKTPTKLPSNNPTENPTDNPSGHPTDNPTQNPSNNPTGNPTNNPTQNPSINPTTGSPSLDSLTARIQEYEADLNNLAKLYQYLTVGFVAVMIVICMISLIDAKCVRINDYFKITAIVSMVIHSTDMMSDCFFVAQVSIQYKIQLHFQYEIILFASIVCIIFPTFASLFQLYFYAKKHWLNNAYIRSWLSQYTKVLLLLSVITGSSFGAVSILNSYIFQLNIFDMGLTDKQLQAFRNKRVYSIVLLENMPQLVFQTYYIYLQGAENPITISSIIFSIISIIVSILNMAMQKTIINIQRYVILSMDITGDCVEQRSSKCRTMKKDIQQRIAALIGVDQQIIEVIKPTYISNGLSLSIHVYGTDNNNHHYIQYLMNANDGKLSKLFQNHWKLSDKPIVSNIKSEIVESKEQRRNTEIMMDLQIAPNAMEMQIPLVHNIQSQ